MNILITGGSGFIGTNLVEALLEKDFVSHIYCIDKLTDASNTHVSFLATIDDRVSFIFDDINNISDYDHDLLGSPDVCIHLAAESHVDRSIEDSSKFFQTNVFGTYEVALWCCKHDVKLIHFSTDEIYGEIDCKINMRFVETFDIPNPRNPYSVTKLFAEHMIDLAEVEHDKVGLTIKVRPCNNFGPWQDYSKLIPTCIYKIQTKDCIPLYGQGEQVREWMYVKDTCFVVCKLVEMIKLDESLPSIMNIGSGTDLCNRDLVNNICDLMDVSPEEAIEFVNDPRGNMHDQKYAVENSLMMSLAGPEFLPKHFHTALENTVDWYEGRLI